MVSLAIVDPISLDLLTPKSLIAQNGNIATQGTITAIGDLTALNIYTKTAVTSLLAQTNQTITAATNMVEGKLVTETYLRICYVKSDQVLVSCMCDRGLRVCNGITIGISATSSRELLAL